MTTSRKRVREVVTCAGNCDVKSEGGGSTGGLRRG